jgi:valyl-tRNA synthetase
LDDLEPVAADQYQLGRYPGPARRLLNAADVGQGSGVRDHLHLAFLYRGQVTNEQGKKISKRDLEAYNDSDSYNRYDPASVIDKYGADALRYWAAGARLGHDLRYNEKHVRSGRKMVVKLWNVARLYATYLTDFDPDLEPVPFRERPTEDRWLLSHLARVVEQVTDAFEGYDYAQGREVLEKFFWALFATTTWRS